MSATSATVEAYVSQVVIGKTIWIRIRVISVREKKLTYNYYTDGEKLIPCRCRPGCKTRL